MTGLPWIYDDGGRGVAGFKGETGDCAARALAIAVRMDYLTVYDAINEIASAERPRRGKKASNARTGVWRRTVDAFLGSAGWEWTPTMAIGSGCTTHLAIGELPAVPRLVAVVSKHYVAVIDGVVRDTHDPTRDGTRCVYGYFTPIVGA